MLERTPKALRATSPKRPDPIDVQVGARLRLARVNRNVSQERLAEALGVTFQQVQKYEKGVNRMGPSRLAPAATLAAVNALPALLDRLEALAAENADLQRERDEALDRLQPWVTRAREGRQRAERAEQALAEKDAALREISERHISSQPMTDGGDELSWAHRQYAELRRIAYAALHPARDGGAGDALTAEDAERISKEVGF